MTILSRKIHAVIFCWPSKEGMAHKIANAIKDHVEYLTVVYKNDSEKTENGVGNWKKINNSYYYGRQFRCALELMEGDVLLQIQADAEYSDWPALISRCRMAFKDFPEIGVWSPNVYHSWYTPNLTRISDLRSSLVAVSLTDGVVWALSSKVTEKMKMLDYECNNYGWGLTEAGAATAVTNDLLVAMDLSLHVVHPRGSGYDRAKALEQSKKFTEQLSISQQNYINLALIAAKLKDKASVRRYFQPHYWWTKLHGRGAVA